MEPEASLAEGRTPWQLEPDREEWRDPATGLPCLIVRNLSGALCGYVGVAPGHPWYGVTYDAVEPQPEVHGGMTYSGECSGHICHVPEPGEPDHVWWLGFDCAHVGDIRPFSYEAAKYLTALVEGHSTAPRVYRDIAYVRREVTALAAQMGAA